jgi:hypothetical protein
MSGSATSSITAVSPSAMAASAGAVDKCVDTLIKLKSTDTCYNGQNYYTWASTISDTLESYGLAEVLTDDTHPHGKRLKAAIAMCVGAAYHDEARKCANAKELWDYFETSNKKEAGIRKLQLHAELLDLKRVPNEPLAEYLARAFKLKSSVAAAGVNISDDDMSLYLLRGLGDDEHFALVKGLYTIDVSDKSKPAPSLATLVAQLQAFDINFGKKPSTSRSGSNPATALIAPSGGFRPKFNGGGSSRPATNGYKLKPFMRQQSPTLPGTSKPGVVCYYCRKSGHVIRDCRARKASEARKGQHLHGRNSGPPSKPPTFSNRPNSSQQTSQPAAPSADVAWTSTTAPFTAEPYEFFLDSGASRHVTPYASILQGVVPILKYITTGDGTVLEATATGTVVLEDSDSQRVTLNNVLLVPGIKYNLVSTSAIRRAGGRIVSESNATTIYCGDYIALKAYDHPIVGIPCYQSAAVGTAFAAFTNTTEAAELWHQRFGHLGYANMIKLARHEMVDGLPVSAGAFGDHIGKENCDACAIGKLIKSPFYPAVHKARAAGELLHTDVCGPIQPDTAGGNKYFMTVTDDFTRYSMVKLIKYKSDVTSSLIEYINLVEKQTGNPVKALRSDNGGEYTSNQLDAFLKDKGIVHEYSLPYTPQQNGVAERLNRTLLDKAIPMLDQSGLPLKHWGDAIVTANYLKNLSPTSASSVTPYEAFFGYKPNVSNLRVFGCRAFVLTPSHARTKLEPRAKAGVFIGYPYLDTSTFKGYRVLLDDGTYTASRHVIFKEGEFPYIISKPANSLTLYGLAPGNTVEFHYFHAPTSKTTSNVNVIDGSGSDNLDGNGNGGSVDNTTGNLAADNADISDDPAPVSSPAPPSSPAVADTPTSSAPPLPPASDRILRPRDAHGRVAKPNNQLPEPAAEISAPPAAPELPRAHNFPLVPRMQDGNTALLAADPAANIIAEPSTFKEAMASPQGDLWLAASNDEYASLLANDTWDLLEPPPGTNVIPCKWVFKVKRDANGNVERFKARLVVKGFHQREGIDFTEVFAPTAKYSAFRAFMGVTAVKDLELRHIDIKTAFLNGILEEEVWMQQPEGYVQGGSHLACKLKRALYGLKQAPRAWYTRLHQELMSMGFSPSLADPGLYTACVDGNAVKLLIYVDDILVACSDSSIIDRFCKRLLSSFDGRDLGDVSHFLGISIQRDRVNRTIQLSQARMVRDLLVKFSMDEAKPRVIPLSTSLRLSKDEGEPLDTAAHPYSGLVGSLMYLAIGTRPDIAYAVSLLARFMSAPSAVHYQAAKGVLRYLAATVDYKLCFGGSDCNLYGYSDADFAADIDTRRSVTGYVFTMGGGAVSWSSKRQATVAASTTEAEYVAASSTVKEALWLRNLLADMGAACSTVNIYGDNQAALKLLRNPISSVRTKHIDVAHHFVRERVARGEVSFTYLSTDKMVADALTKAVPQDKLKYCCTGMGLQQV